MRKRVRAVLMRGGTSKGLFFREEDLPKNPAERDSLLLKAFGSPDAYGRQMNGLGGGTSVTSKVAIIGKPQANSSPLLYTFGQVSITEPVIDYKGNCGNLSSAVAPYAVDEGIVEPAEPETIVRILNTNTRKTIVAHVPTRDGAVLEDGDYRIAGVSGTGARIGLDFLEPGGAVTGKLLPTGNTQDEVRTMDGRVFRVSVVDVSAPVVFVPFRDLGLDGDERPDRIDSDHNLLRTLQNIRASAAVLMGLAAGVESVSPAIPKIAMVGPPASYDTASGERIAEDSYDVQATIMSMGKVHRAYAITGGICTAVAARLDETVVWRCANKRADAGSVKLGHPSGTIEFVVKMQRTEEGIQVPSVTVYRTARRLMEGFALV